MSTCEAITMTTFGQYITKLIMKWIPNCREMSESYDIIPPKSKEKKNYSYILHNEKPFLGQLSVFRWQLSTLSS